MFRLPKQKNFTEIDAKKRPGNVFFSTDAVTFFSFKKGSLCCKDLSTGSFAPNRQITVEEKGEGSRRMVGVS